MKDKKDLKGILFDVDGVVVKSEMFSVQYQKKFEISNDEMLPFFTGIFQECIVGKADLKEALPEWLAKWKLFLLMRFWILFRMYFKVLGFRLHNCTFLVFATRTHGQFQGF